MKNKKKKEEEPAEDWDLGQGMGIFPDDVSLTQNIGCVGGGTSKSKNQEKNSKK
jgi:hypothetical protein